MQLFFTLPVVKNTKCVNICPKKAFFGTCNNVVKCKRQIADEYASECRISFRRKFAVRNAVSVIFWHWRNNVSLGAFGGTTMFHSVHSAEIAGREERSDGIGIEKQSRHILHSAFVEALKGKTLP